MKKPLVDLDGKILRLLYDYRRSNLKSSAVRLQITRDIFKIVSAEVLSYGKEISDWIGKGTPDE